uniref:Uncharacterized protein n=1 Tax=Rhizophora mucronata TaxID=61149 RepID=A0A2P2IMZ6_RHIMU
METAMLFSDEKVLSRSTQIQSKEQDYKKTIELQFFRKSRDKGKSKEVKGTKGVREKKEEESGPKSKLSNEV